MNVPIDCKCGHMQLQSCITNRFCRHNSFVPSSIKLYAEHNYTGIRHQSALNKLCTVL